MRSRWHIQDFIQPYPGHICPPVAEGKFLRDDGTWQTAGGSGGAPTFTAVEKDLGAGKSSGVFSITGLSGLTTNKIVDIRQTAAPIVSKGNARDESELDSITLTGYVLDASTIQVFWRATGVVVGNYAFGYMVSA